MKKKFSYFVIGPAAAALAAGLIFVSSDFSGSSDQNKSISAGDTGDSSLIGKLIRKMLGNEFHSHDEHAGFDQTASSQAHPSELNPASRAAQSSHRYAEAAKKSDGPESRREVRTTDSSENGPSIGTIKVLGHRGCDSNTPGWFLSVGTPEQYNFTVSDDGETLEVEPNTAALTGNFEFIHCADQREFIGKRVRLTASIKAQDVTQTAQLRLRGENPQREAILNEEQAVTGTYDWRDFSVEADVGSEVTLFSYGLTFRSAGKLWFSHPVFTVLP